MKDWDAIYDVLVRHAGAVEFWRDQFVQLHASGSCDEFRFQGALGFGGKYRSQRNVVDCYREDETPERRKMIEATNAALASMGPQS